eukprot:Blabericola_migrator_1__4602@NODE_2441_length_2756_cov_34_866121_g1529_i0_p1_GENE_NODE_2441_length_2756_cov_34_866121_g1529_i0NODE_2441_length_2756_cov_34_866121_g1529_i0_p1_ORF_typecomplete_len417_score77_63FeoC/PF09012_10/0_4FeoC/PF09012_10/1_1e03_NODE_2441_length_2756_cov_34_866121_g1529_i014552705
MWLWAALFSIVECAIFSHHHGQVIPTTLPSLEEMEPFKVEATEWPEIDPLFNSTNRMAHGSRVLSTYIATYIARYWLPRETPLELCQRALVRAMNATEIRNERENRADESGLYNFLMQMKDNGCVDNMRDQMEHMGDVEKVSDIHPYPFCAASYYNQLPETEAALFGQVLREYVQFKQTVSFRTLICPFSQRYYGWVPEVCVLLNKLLEATHTCVNEDIRNLDAEIKTFGEGANMLQVGAIVLGWKRPSIANSVAASVSPQTGGVASEVHRHSFHSQSDAGRLSPEIQEKLKDADESETNTFYKLAVEDALPSLIKKESASDQLKIRLEEAKAAATAGDTETVKRIKSELKAGSVSIKTALRTFEWFDSMRKTAQGQLLEYWQTHPTRKWRMTINLWPFLLEQYDMCLRLILDNSS